MLPISKADVESGKDAAPDNHSDNADNQTNHPLLTPPRLRDCQQKENQTKNGKEN